MSNNEKKEGRIVFNGKTEAIYKVIVVGDPAVGKSELLTKFATNEFEEKYLPTVGVSILKEPIELRDFNATVNLMFWDIAGQPQFYMLHRPYFNGADGMLLVFDITRSSTFSNINNWYSAAVKYGLSGIPRILVGNKAHLKGERKIILPMATHLAEKLNAHYYETSTFTGENIRDVFEKIAEEVYRSKEPNIPKKSKKLIIKPYRGESIEVPAPKLAKPTKPAFWPTNREQKYEPPSSNFPHPNFSPPYFPRLYRPYNKSHTIKSKKEKKKLAKEKKKQDKEKIKFETATSFLEFTKGKPTIPKPKSFVSYTPQKILSREEEEKIHARKKKREQKEKAEYEKERRKTVIYGFNGINYYAEFFDAELTKEE